MSSKVPICNLAIAALGHKAFIQSLTESSVEARYSNLYYDAARKAVLRAHPWNFATGRKKLALLGDGVGGWTYKYALPSGCLMARYIVPSVRTIKEKFEVALNDDGLTRVLYANKADAVLVYTHNVENPELFDSLFIDAFHLNLAQRLAPVIAPNKSQEVMAKFVNTMLQAKAVDAAEGEPEDTYETDWLEARVVGMDDYAKVID